MKPLHYFLSIFSVIIITGCSGLKTDIFVNDDGSGAYHLKLDMSEMMSQFKTTFDNFDQDSANAAMVEAEMDEYDGVVDSSFTYESDAELDSLYGVDSLSVESDIFTAGGDYSFSSDGQTQEQFVEPPKTAMQVKMMALMESENIDTVITAYEMVPDTVLAQLKRPDLLKNIRLGVLANKVEEKAAIDFGFTFKKISELKETVSELSLAQYLETKDTADLASLGSTLETMDHLKIDPKARLITVETYSMEGDPAFAGDMSAFSDMPEEELSQTLAMFGLQDVRIKYHLPSKVKSVKGEVEYQMIDDQTVEIIMPMIKIFKSKISPGYTIQY